MRLRISARCGTLCWNRATWLYRKSGFCHSFIHIFGGFVSFRIIYIKPRYQEYIRQFCNEHMLFDKTFNGKTTQRPYVGIIIKGLFETDYFVPLTTIHSNKVINNTEIYEIKTGQRSLLNFNLMIPVPSSEQIKFDFQELRNINTKNIYQAQSKELNRNQDIITLRAINTYLKVLDNPDSRLAKRSNDFLLLEKKSLEWEESHPSGKKPVRGDKINTQTTTYIEAQKVLGQEKLDQILNR